MIKTIDEKLAKKLELSLKKTKEIRKALVELMTDEFLKGNKVNIKGLGVFEPTTVIKPNHRYFGSKESTTLVNKTIKFRPSIAIKKELKGE